MARKKIAEETDNQIKLVRERSSGKNIFDVEKTVITECQDGTTKKSVIKETYAKVTLRKKRHQTENEVSGMKGGGGAGEGFS